MNSFLSVLLEIWKDYIFFQIKHLSIMYFPKKEKKKSKPQLDSSGITTNHVLSFWAFLHLLFFNTYVN